MEKENIFDSHADDGEIFEGELSSEEKNNLEEISREEIYTPKNKYEKVLYNIYKNDSFAEILKITSYAIVAITVYSFIVKIVTMLQDDFMGAVWLGVITGVPFLAVSLLRFVLNTPRPYEVFEFYKEAPKNKKGRSFPSRHVFSVFIIATVLMPWNVLVGCSLFLLGILLSVIRVLLGIHFIRDVLAGALIGIFSGVIGLLINYLV